MRSFRQWHPQGRAYVLVVDEPEGFFEPSAEEFVVLKLADLKLPDPRGFCFRYDVFSLCNALKPHLLRYLIRQRNECSLLYLDSDIGVFGNLAPIFGRLDENEVLLTPHTHVDFPADGLWPVRSVLLTSGVHNAGVVGVRNSAESLRFLDWWAGALEFECIVDPARGIFVDQRYLDLVPVLFRDVLVLRHDGVNVAHFNLHYRSIRRGNRGWLCNDEPLLLFHFTQVDWPKLRFYARVTRPLMEEQPLLRELLAEFREQLVRADFQRIRSWPYTYDRFANGLPLTTETREVYRRESGTRNQANDPFADTRWIRVQRGYDRRRRWQEWRAVPGKLCRRLGLISPRS